MSEFLFLSMNPILLGLAEGVIALRSCSVSELNETREEEGEYHRLFPKLMADPDKFHNYMRMSIACFQYIEGKLEVQKSTNFIKCPINNEHRLMLTLRYLSTGQSFHSLHYSFRLGISTVRQKIYSTCQEIWELFSTVHLALPSKEKFEDISRDFQNLWQYPNCLGCIDGKHIRIKNPEKAGTLHLNYCKFFSIVLQAVVDAKYRFICVDIGGYGHQHDAGTFRQSMFYDVVMRNKDQIPDPRPLPNRNLTVPFVFLGDEAYPLLPNLMRPYPKAALNAETQYYNDRHSRARKTVECAFGIMTMKWRLLWKPIEVQPERVDDIVKCICVLHNLIMDMDGTPHFGNKNVTFSRTERRNLHNHPENLAVRIREEYKTYFSNNIIL